MLPLTPLWLPIVLSAVVVFLASWVVWTLLPIHRSDWSAVTDERALRDAFYWQQLAPGQYHLPHAGGVEALKNPEYVRKLEEGPHAFITLLPPGKPAMGRNMALYFLFDLAVSLLVAYVASLALPAGANHLQVFRVTGTVAVLGYAAGHIPNAIWFGKPWSATWKEVFDGVVYGLLTAGIFGWLWPR